MNRIYLDYSATTPLAPEVLEAMRPYLTEHFGNPSSIHSFGRETKVAVEAAREKLSTALGAQPQEIAFTSGGTEAGNLAIFGVAGTFAEPQHVVTSRIEHPCVLNSCRELEQRGWKITYLEPEVTGMISAQAVAEAIRPDTVLISIMHANNEVGTINPIADIATLAAERKILFHSDAVQTFGKLPLDVRQIPVSLLSLSAHKIYGPKGMGALFVRRGVKLQPLLFGGHQERDRRAGTENVAGIVGLGKAAELMIANQAAESERLRALSENFWRRVQQIFPGATMNGNPASRLPAVLNLSFPGFESTALLMSLDLQGIAVSNGSACSSGSVEVSHVLRAMKLPQERAVSALRFSFGKYTTEAEIETTLQALEKILQRKSKSK
ncbi:MAG: cysteine desulfurase [candidate division KSB1 bacterium]|nr:cysteine desulfurase [candidate division KSB1 bacterium]MDZ7365141.1 cysteine desulfurase [candidate division KSB1 bacterium]MDZ7404351.1 cysteine desulfurase [candidate division KSB1 bacterium]